MRRQNVLLPKFPLEPTEAEVQALIVDGLRFLGYTVLVTSRRRSRGPDGADRGIPDLLVTRARGGTTEGAWPYGMWLGLEVKGPPTRISAEQAELIVLGRVLLVRSFDEARAAVENFESSLRSRGQ